MLAGPVVLARSLRGDSAMHRGHPGEPHFFVWMLAVSPAAQRTGVGRALLTTALARAEELGVPTYLDTAKPENLPYYGSVRVPPTGAAGRPPLPGPGKAGDPAVLRLVRVPADGRDSASTRRHALVHVPRHGMIRTCPTRRQSGSSAWLRQR